jgi:hypothetical protein
MMSRTASLRSLAIAGGALVIVACGSDPEGASPPATEKTTQRQDSGGQRISAHYVDTVSEWGRDVDVITTGDQIRLQWSAPRDDPPTLYYWVYDGDRILEHISDGEIPNTLYESPQRHRDLYEFTQSWVLPLGSDMLERACPDGRRLGTRTIAGRAAVGFRCTSKKRRTPGYAKEVWIDRTSGLILQADRGLQADKVTEDPLIDRGTFSTEPPQDEKVKVVQR